MGLKYAGSGYREEGIDVGGVLCEGEKGGIVLRGYLCNDQKEEIGKEKEFETHYISGNLINFKLIYYFPASVYFQASIIFIYFPTYYCKSFRENSDMS